MNIQEAPNLVNSDDSGSDSDVSDVESEKSVQAKSSMLGNYITEYMKIDDELSELRAVMREKTKRKKIVHEQIIDIYREKELDHVKLKSGAQVNMNVKKTMTMGKSVIESALSKFLGSETEGKKATEFIYENRVAKISNVLKILNN